MKFQELLAYQKSFELAMEVFYVSKQFPKAETYSLTDQIRRSSRSVAVNIAESYRKRLYPKYFISKLSDSDAENSETQAWLEFALACDYMSKKDFKKLYTMTEEIGKLLNYMMSNPKKFGSK